MSIAATYYYHLAQSTKFRLAIAFGASEADRTFPTTRLDSAIALNFSTAPICVSAK